MRRAAAFAGPDRKSGSRPNSNRVTQTRMTRTRPVAARADPGRCPAAGSTGPGDSDAWERVRRHRIRRSHPTPKCICKWPGQSALHSKTHAHRRCENVPDRGQGRGRRRQGSAPSARQSRESDQTWAALEGPHQIQYPRQFGKSPSLFDETILDEKWDLLTKTHYIVIRLNSYM